MKIAIVSSGLWHVRRGIETWASTLAEALARRGLNITLFTGSKVTSDNGQVPYKIQVMPCWYRGTRKNTWMTNILSRIGGWRYGFGSEYQTEQTTMAPKLIKALRRDGFDIVHLQDPWLAMLLEKVHRKQQHAAEVILAHGTEEPLDFLRKFQHVQELSPHYLANHGVMSMSGWTRHSVPNFVNTDVFRPADKFLCRKSLGLPHDTFIVLSVGAIDHKHKRMQWLVDEFTSMNNKNSVLVVAGPCNSPEISQFITNAKNILGERFTYFANMNHLKMPDLYSAADVFVLCSTSEIFGIVFLEAMACGIPCVGHTYPVTEWIIGDCGTCIDMKSNKSLSSFLSNITPDWIVTHGKQARDRTVKMFSAKVVVEQIVEMYQEVLRK
ncbi:MAG: glycosyltransferase family 4 protein [Kiritimatiellae bacterium]|nr:glycosyltransferase family 4 protein [Kiritimatiellia bacterium]MDD5521895.1 glycosyltransferase family 4 protein [Kiritimatiellia bacterium]